MRPTKKSAGISVNIAGNEKMKLLLNANFHGLDILPFIVSINHHGLSLMIFDFRFPSLDLFKQLSNFMFVFARQPKGQCRSIMFQPDDEGIITLEKSKKYRKDNNPNIAPGAMHQMI